MSQVQTKVDTKVQRFTIWDNFERHVLELKAIGATDDDLKSLREAAEAVSAEEDRVNLRDDKNPVLDDQTLQTLTAPRQCANGWTIQPPTLPAKRWATTALLKVTGGDAPNDPVAMAFSIMAGLWVLKMWAENRKDRVMQVLCAPGALADLLPSLVLEAGDSDINALADDFSELMGFSKKKRALLLKYEKLLSQLQSHFQPGKTSIESIAGSSDSSSPPGAPSA